MPKSKIYEHKKIPDSFFYGGSIADDLILNRFRYRGRGRPRNSDYAPLRQIQRIINSYFNKYLDSLHHR